MIDIPRHWGVAGLSLAVGLTFAIDLADWTHELGWLSLTPPDGGAADTGPENLKALYQSAYTAWITLALLLPVFALVWFRNRSVRAWNWWLAFWVVSWFAYMVHLYVSMFHFFGGDFAWMKSSSRVSAFWPGMVLALWWPVDAWLAFRHVPETRLVLVQRILVHLGTFVLFFGGSALKGELLTIKVLGAILAAVAVFGVAAWAHQRSGRGL